MKKAINNAIVIILLITFLVPNATSIQMIPFSIQQMEEWGLEIDIVQCNLVVHVRGAHRAQIRLLDANEQEVAQSSYLQGPDLKWEFSIMDLPSGNYTIEVQTPEGQRYKVFKI